MANYLWNKNGAEASLAYENLATTSELNFKDIDFDAAFQNVDFGNNKLIISQSDKVTYANSYKLLKFVPIGFVEGSSTAAYTIKGIKYYGILNTSIAKNRELLKVSRKSVTYHFENNEDTKSLSSTATYFLEVNKENNKIKMTLYSHYQTSSSWSLTKVAEGYIPENKTTLGFVIVGGGGGAGESCWYDISWNGKDDNMLCPGGGGGGGGFVYGQINLDGLISSTNVGLKITIGSGGSGYTVNMKTEGNDDFGKLEKRNGYNGDYSSLATSNRPNYGFGNTVIICTAYAGKGGGHGDTDTGKDDSGGGSIIPDKASGGNGGGYYIYSGNIIVDGKLTTSASHIKGIEGSAGAGPKRNKTVTTGSTAATISFEPSAAKLSIGSGRHDSTFDDSITRSGEDRTKVWNNCKIAGGNSFEAGSYDRKAPGYGGGGGSDHCDGADGVFILYY